MAREKVIRFFRGLAANLPALDPGEPAFSTDSEKLYVGGNSGNVIINDAASRFGTCSTAAATAAKTVTVGQFGLEAGAWVLVLFSNTNSAASPTLNVNGTGAKPIYYRNAAITAANLTNTRLHMFMYDGTQYEFVGDIDTNTTYSSMSASELSTGTATTGRVISAKVLTDWLISLIGLDPGKLVGVGTDGKIDQTLIPHQSITDVFVVASQAEMLALSNAASGDVAIRTDVSATYILQAVPASTLTNWVLLPTPSAPVLSVAGKTGVVTLTASDVGLDDTTLAGKVRAVVLTGLSTATKTAITATDTILAALGKLQGQLGDKAPLASPTFTGTPAAPTAAAGTSTTQLATTAFVQGEIGTVDGGTF
jgi:hypothetical protein